MNSGSDILVFDQNDRPILAIEAKTKLDASVEWAMRLRRNILAHGLLPKTEFFLIATPNRFFIWKNSGMDSLLSEPTRTIESSSFLSSYFMQTGVTPEEISGSSFELIINSWLAELMYSGVKAHQARGSYQWIADLGLQDALAGGHLDQRGRTNQGRTEWHNNHKGYRDANAS